MEIQGAGCWSRIRPRVTEQTPREDNRCLEQLTSCKLRGSVQLRKTRLCHKDHSETEVQR